MRKLIRIVLGAILLILIALGAVWYYADTLARTGIEKGATYALGVPTTVGNADVGLLGGTLRVERLTVANPAGFKTPHLAAVRRFDLGVVPGSLLEDVIRVNRFEIEGLDLHIEQKVGKSNVSTVLDHVKSRAGGGEPSEPPPGEERDETAGRKVKADRVVLRNTVAHVQVLPALGEMTTVDVEIPEIVLEDVASDDAQGVAVAELTRRILPAVLAAVIKKGRGTVPDLALDRLADDVGETTRALGHQARHLVEQVGKDAGGLLEKIFKQPAGGGKEGGGLGETLEGIFKKEDEGGGDEKKEGGLGEALEGLFKKDENP